MRQKVVYKLHLYLKALSIISLLSCLKPSDAHAQYFGENKVRYKKLNFSVFKTPHFRIYYYLHNDSMVKRFAQESELWYTVHQQIFKDTFKKPNPIILYANHPDFQQTTVIDGQIDVGTGGITEGLKNRVLMPVMETNQMTRHVIGHELVHAFQYHLLLGKDSATYENIYSLPLWMIEGMAEYLSLGKKDPFTAMWMRDAYLNHDIPSLKALTETNKYFPYRYGQAFWAFIGLTYSDTLIMPFFKNTARLGLEKGIKKTFNIDEKTLSSLWKASVETTYKPFLKDSIQRPPGKVLIDSKNSGKMNLAPSISPDGNLVAFLSEKSLLSIDLYLANARTGAILRKLATKESNSHIDEFNFIESAGCWSPDSKRFAFSVFNKGRNSMVIVDVSSGKILSETAMGKARQFSNLSWSPDGKNIVIQGLAEGQVDLYLYNLSSGNLKQLTNDKFTDYQPSFSPDGEHIVFASDRTTYDSTLSKDITFNLEVLSLKTGKISDLKAFNGANNLNPAYSADGSMIYFLSDRDGFRNLYRFILKSGKIQKMTSLFTGISGITEYSPALTISAANDIIYSYYRAQKYSLYKTRPAELMADTINANDINFDVALLPPGKSKKVDVINSNLKNFLAYPKLNQDSIKNIPFKPMFKLDYLATGGFGAAISQYGSGLSSGLQGVFSDILGRNQIYAGIAINGEVYDLGGQVTYIKQEGRWNFGTGISHIPYQTANYSVIPVNFLSGTTTVPATEERFDLIRIFQDQLSLFTSYPFSRKVRIEFGAGAAAYYYKIDRYSTTYDTVGNVLSNTHTHITNAAYNNDPSNNGVELNPFTIFNGYAALVGDDSFFGIASPLSGYRYRLQAEYDFGTYKFFAPTIDLRKYYRVLPFTLAARLYGYGRFGSVGNLYQLYVGYPYLIRGYEAQTFFNNNGKIPSNGFSIQQLSGNRLAVANLELRLPFTGPEKLSQIKSKFLFTELSLFFDAGLAWNQGDQIIFKSGPGIAGYTPELDPNGIPVTDDKGKQLLQPVYKSNQRVPALSSGVSLRINIFGYFVLEPYLAIPFNRTDIKKPVFGLGFTPGW